jgi:hypothetical protein
VISQCDSPPRPAVGSCVYHTTQHIEIFLSGCQYSASTAPLQPPGIQFVPSQSSVLNADGCCKRTHKRETSDHCGHDQLCKALNTISDRTQSSSVRPKDILIRGTRRHLERGRLRRTKHWAFQNDCNQLCGVGYCSRGHQLCSHSVVSQNFMELKDSLPRSQELSTCTYPEPNKPSPQHSILSLKGPS